jgi:(5-formylfuran-3-yl)methyl phosphate synthase
MRLLVSVVDAAEARVAAAAGADVIDVKDPSRGALGEASPAVVRAVRRATPARLLVSVALGDGPFTPEVAASRVTSGAAAGAAFVKLGLRQTPRRDAGACLQAARASLPEGVKLVAAGFADFERAGAPHPLELPGLAAAAGAHGCLLDTAVKDGRGLFHWLDEAALVAFVRACHTDGLLAALAGSLRAEDFERLAPIGPDLVGIRGAACAGDRVGRIDPERVHTLIRARDTWARGRTATSGGFRHCAGEPR